MPLKVDARIRATHHLLVNRMLDEATAVKQIRELISDVLTEVMPQRNAADINDEGGPYWNDAIDAMDDNAKELGL
jgi:hypothetical protein